MNPLPASSLAAAGRPRSRHSARAAIAGLLAAASLAVTPAQAGRPCDEQPPQLNAAVRGLALDEGVTDRAQAQAWLGLRGFRPSVLRIGPLTRLGANLTRANVAFDDHPASKRLADRIETVTVDSVFDWLGRSGLGQAQPTKVTE